MGEVVQLFAPASAEAEEIPAPWRALIEQTLARRGVPAAKRPAVMSAMWLAWRGWRNRVAWRAPVETWISMQALEHLLAVFVLERLDAEIDRTLRE